MKREKNIKGKVVLNLKDIKRREVKLLTSGIKVIVEKNKEYAVCPNCGALSNKVYEYRKQLILDKPNQDKKVEIELNKRRFTCANNECSLKTFTENIEGLSSTRRYTVAFENFLKDLVSREGYLKAQKVLQDKYSLSLSLTTLFYLNYSGSKEN
ncbi:MAG: transposase family protein [Candidatus Kaelpia aquatica]|nr:transposase family protein [Candidatus Kaelpia aquatica]